MEHLTLEKLKALPTISVSQADDLKVETDNFRVWLSRATIEDGAPYNNAVTVERLISGRWVIVSETIRHGVLHKRLRAWLSRATDEQRKAIR